MNKRYVLKNAHEETVSCVLSAEQNPQDEWETVFGIRKGYGLGVDVREKTIAVVDHFHADTVTKFEILSVTDTDEPTRYQLTAVPNL